jgi:hypothetical protein
MVVLPTFALSETLRALLAVISSESSIKAHHLRSIPPRQGKQKPQEKDAPAARSLQLFLRRLSCLGSKLIGNVHALTLSSAINL